jgi:hypothetical protein
MSLALPVLVVTLSIYHTTLLTWGGHRAHTLAGRSRECDDGADAARRGRR